MNIFVVGPEVSIKHHDGIIAVKVLFNKEEAEREAKRVSGYKIEEFKVQEIEK